MNKMKGGIDNNLNKKLIDLAEDFGTLEKRKHSKFVDYKRFESEKYTNISNYFFPRPRLKVTGEIF